MKQKISIIISFILLILALFFGLKYMIENDWYFKIFLFKDGYVEEIDGKKYYAVASYTNRMRKNVYCYENYNFFAYQKTKDYIFEFYDYDNYIFPEFREYHKENLNDSIIYYYDDYGNITDIQKRDESGKIIEVEK